MKRLALAAVILGVLVGGFNTAFASSGYSAIDKRINIVLNGARLQLERELLQKNNRILVPARAVFNRMGANFDWNQSSKTIEISEGNISIKLNIGSSIAYVNGKAVKIDAPPVLSRGIAMVPVRFVAENLKADVGYDGGSKSVLINNSSNTSRGDTENKGYTVVIDAGHGGSETGASYGGIYEKDLNLDIAKRLNILLEAQGVATYMTRTDDSTVSLYDRAGLANRLNADLFISVHNNAEPSMAVKGTMTLYYPSSSHSKGNLSPSRFAEIMLDELTGDLGTNNLKTIERPNLVVLRTTDMPAVIAEVGYMTQKDELVKLEDSDYRQQAAQALCNGVMKSLKEIEN